MDVRVGLSLKSLVICVCPSLLSFSKLLQTFVEETRFLAYRGFHNLDFVDYIFVV